MEIDKFKRVHVVVNESILVSYACWDSNTKDFPTSFTLLNELPR
jgi:hypothetical protein